MPKHEQGTPSQESTPAEETQVLKGEAFTRHLDHASSVVRTWPAWKQEILGGVAWKPRVNASRGGGA